MNTRIDKDYYFQTALHYEDEFFVVVYDITLSMLIETESSREQYVALERLEHFIKYVLQNSLIINGEETEYIKKYQLAGINTCELPDDPMDQIFALVLMQKLNAVMEDRIKITDISLSSSASNGIRFGLVSEVAESLFSEGKNWWNCPNTCLRDNDPRYPGKNEPDNVLELFAISEWDTLDLAWKEKCNK